MSDTETDSIGQFLQTLRSASPNRAGQKNVAATGSGKLAQEIHEEFLVCKICLEAYKSPKSLSCLHTFCEQCIEGHVMSECTYKKYSDYREFTCPLCRKRTTLPIGGVKKLPDNFLVSSLNEIVGRQRPSKFPFCDMCKVISRKHKEAASKCLDCAKLLCRDCVKMHKETKVTQSHSIFDVEIEKDVECKEHPDEVVRFYCEPCETCICVLCTFNEHKDHEVSQFGEAVVKYKENITTMLDACKTKIAKYDSQIDVLNNCEEILKETEQKIHDTAIKYISEIRNREKVLVEELRNLYGKETMDIVENKRDMAIAVDGLRSTIALTEVILKGKDIELLLLKRDVQEKLSSLDSVEIKSLPATIYKKVNFVAGNMDMGYIQDMDRPLLSKMRHKRVTQGEDDDLAYLQREASTQTDHVDHARPRPARSRRVDTDTDSDSDDTEDKKATPVIVDSAMQTEPAANQSEESSDQSESESEEDLPRPEMRYSGEWDQAVETDDILTEEKSVNTRSRSLQGQGQGPGREDDLAARRRRRRELAQAQHRASLSLDLDDQDHEDDASDVTLDQEPQRRSSRLSRMLSLKSS